MDDFPALKLHNSEDVQGAKQPVIDNGEITSPDLTGMIPQKSPPILARGRQPPHPMDVFLNGPLAQTNTQLENFPSDPFRSPKTIFQDHLA